MNLKLATLFLVGVSCAHGEKNGLRNSAQIETVRSESLSSGLVVDFVRRGKGQGSGQMCVDSQKRRFDYGERKLNKDEGRTVNDCAQHCVGTQQEESDLMRHMVGFNFHFEDSLCQCLYKNKELKSTSGFDSLVVKHEGEGEVDGVELKSGWQCYGLDLSQSKLRPFRKKADENSSGDADEEQTRVGNKIDVDLTVTYGLANSSSSASRSRRSYRESRGNNGRGGNNAGASSLCTTDVDCTNPDLPFCRLGSSCRGQGVCGAAPDSCPTSESK